MEGVTDAPMRALQGQIGAFTFAVSEFQRVSIQPIPKKVFVREVPELLNGAKTSSGLPVAVQLLGGHPERMALSALKAISAGATCIDLNFGCPAKTVNRNDGGACLLQYPQRIYDIVRAVRGAMPPHIPVSAKLRLGWDSTDAIYKNAEQAVKAGASWLTIHARTKAQAYNPPVFYEPIRRLREQLDVPIIANGDIFSLEDFKRCRGETDCLHFMIGRGALARPYLSHEIAAELGLPTCRLSIDNWGQLAHLLVQQIFRTEPTNEAYATLRIKQWLNMARLHGDFGSFNEIKRESSFCAILKKLSATPIQSQVTWCA